MVQPSSPFGAQVPLSAVFLCTTTFVPGGTIGVLLYQTVQIKKRVPIALDLCVRYGGD